MIHKRRGLIHLGCLALAVVLALAAPWPAGAVPARSVLVVTIGDSPDPAPGLGQVIYSINVKNDGRFRAFNVRVTMPVPQGTQFIKCAVTPKRVCTLSGGVVSTTIGTMAAHLQIKVSVTLAMPAVSTTSVITVSADANGDSVTDGKASITTTILAAAVPVTFLPSNTAGAVSCGDTLTSSTFQTDTTVKFLGGLGCASGSGLKITASGKTIDLNKNKITGASAKGNVGIRIGAGTTGVSIIGGSTSGTAGIEYFDYCVKEEGNNTNTSISTLRCFRARSAGIYSVSNGVNIAGILVDKAVGTATTTEILPGGVGIWARGNAHIKDTIVRRTGGVGIWADGANDPDADGRVVLIDGNTTTSRVETSAGVGIRLDGGPHKVKDTFVQGDALTGPGKDGVIIGDTGIGSDLDGVIVKDHGGNGVVVGGTGATISRSSVDAVALDGFVVTASGATLSGNSAVPDGNGFVISGAGNSLATNTAEDAGGDGFVVSGPDATLSGNTAKTGGGRGFVISGSGGAYNTNTAEANAGQGFLISGGAGGSNTFAGNRAKQNTGAGFEVPGTANHFDTNKAEFSGGAEWIIGPGNFNDGGNTANGGQFSFTSAGGTFE